VAIEPAPVSANTLLEGFEQYTDGVFRAKWRARSNNANELQWFS